MSRIENIRLQHVRRILDGYRFDQPFHLYLKNYFRENKQAGSKDRKFLRQYTYDWFRLGLACTDNVFELRLAKAIFLTEKQPSSFFMHLSSLVNWLPEPVTWAYTIQEKLKQLAIPLHAVFPMEKELSAGLNTQLFIEGFFKQPNLWLRSRRGKEPALEQQLKRQGIGFEKHATYPQAYALPNGSNAETEGLAEVQDLSSQRVTEYLTVELGAKVWDCCAASGGKSLALADAVPGILLYVSDTRDKILENLKQRFAVNEIRKFNYSTIDLSLSKKTLSFTDAITNKSHQVEPGFFDCVLVDAPCSGSGTWARSPEQLQQMNGQIITHYASLQQTIVQHALPFLKSGGLLVYITCSVFAQENEQQVSRFQDQHRLQLKSQHLLQGTEEGADCMFVAVFQKN